MVMYIYLFHVNLSESSDSEISGRYSPVCSDTEIEAGQIESEDAVDMTAGRRAANELNAAQVAHDLDELIMEDDESVDEEVPLEGNKVYSVEDCFYGIYKIIVRFCEMGDKIQVLYFPEDNNKIDTNTKSSRIACILVLLFRVSHGACSSYGAIREEPVSNHTLELLTGRECLNALLDYVERCKRPLGRAARILARVLRY